MRANTMDCKKAQALYDALADGLLAEPLAIEVQRHFEACTDCRVLRQRAIRLQQLLALKRHEQPPPGYFESFLDKFHRRLATEMMRPTWWQRIAGAWRQEITPLWRYCVAGACVAAVAVGFAWQVYHVTVGSRTARSVVAASTGEPAAPATVVTALPVALQSEPGQPHYVLERITVLPVGYETARVRF